MSAQIAEKPETRHVQTQYADWNEWNPKHYIEEYYGGITLDGQYAMEWIVESMQKVGEVPIALEFGCGPVPLFMFPVAPKAGEIHMAEYLAANRAELGKWVGGDADAHDWLEFSLDTLKLEGQPHPTENQARQREQLVRERITQIYAANAADADPLGPQKRGFYPLVISYCCADSATDEKETYQRYLGNIAGLVAVGGTLILAACESHSFYKVGERCYPGACVNSQDMISTLKMLGFTDLDVRVRHVPDSSEQGFNSTMFARALKGA